MGTEDKVDVEGTGVFAGIIVVNNVVEGLDVVPLVQSFSHSSRSLWPT